ncbi:hypothetical protein GH714_002874 [Hevea brasiliensis]|uniref:ATP synthase mitochondrial F1 complex assembly factor 1 n=1 Tax=Hevea brasiliensis TaxID=3981 RepID=A0A6A6LYE4_HEVBR|nr:hypothetical protein GH714_002874 [Hevea brasiliensis]
MQRLSSRLSRTLSFSIVSITSLKQRNLTTRSVNSTLQTLRQQEPTIPGRFLKWGSLGFVRTSRFATGFTSLQPKPLDSIMDIERAKDKSPEDLASIWDDYHLGRGHIGASVTAKLYHLLVQRAADCRYFVIPLWRGSGYTTIFAQVQMPHMLFTGLEDYKARGTQAAPYFTASFYTEFAETKDLVLIGEILFLPASSPMKRQSGF